jgi:heavy metal sensor kinase
MRQPPIRIRLTAWYLAVIFACLAAYSVGTYIGLRRAIEDTVDRQLRVRSDNVAHLLETGTARASSNGPQLLPKDIGLGPGDELYQITDAAGAMLYQSPAMRALDVPLDAAHMLHRYRHHRDDGDFTTYYHRQGDIRVLASKVQAGSNQFKVQIATVVSPLYAVLQTFSVWAWIGLPLIICIAGLGGYWLSGRAMQPIHSLVLSTREISEHSLSKRIPVPEAQDELQELASTINAMLERLESAFMRITRFTADASHELRTPVAVIRTTAEVILERERSVEQYQELVGQILRESESTSKLIEHLLILARADADTAQLSLESIDLCGLLQEVEAGAKTLASNSDLDWLTEIPEAPVVVLGDRAHLRRLLLILIDNACRYTEKGGLVTLRLYPQGADAIIEVADTGIGIPAAEVDQIFNRFYRATNARFFDVEGTGLGLSIANWIASAHSGTLSVISKVGSGTSVFVTLPAYDRT